MKLQWPKDKAGLVVGAAGLGMVLVGGLMYWRQRTTGGISGLGRVRYPQAPVIGGYDDGYMKTTLRASADMPIEERIATIQDLVYKGVQDPEMRKVALQITANCAERDQVCEAESIYQAVKHRIRYTGDVGPIMQPDGSVEGIDLYQSARRTWFDMAGGDCDDQFVLVATLLALNGIEPIARVVKTKDAIDWEHIFPVAKIGGREYSLDTTLPGNKSFGREPSYWKKIDFPA